MNNEILYTATVHKAQKEFFDHQTIRKPYLIRFPLFSR